MADCDTLFIGMDYHDKFDPSVYLTYKYGEGRYTDSVNFNLRCYDDAFQSLPSDLSILDYGSGPAILTTISAATKASEIVLSDFTAGNCRALHQWLVNDPDAFDWSSFFSYVVKELDGKTDRQ